MQTDTIELARRLRLRCIELCHLKRSSHVGGALSVIDILAVLFWRIARVDPKKPDWPDRDRIFFSKGHASTAFYAVLEELGFFDGLSDKFTEDGSFFTSHVNHKVPGVELSTGSLGHALSVACGVALAGKRRQATWKAFAILSDGELDEGSNWESILFAPHHRLDNLIVVVDYNKIQSLGTVKDVLNLDPLDGKFRAFGWNCLEIDGHDHTEIQRALESAGSAREGVPTAIVAHTVKGKGVSFMEHQLAWHYKSPDVEELAQARRELGDI